MFAPSPHGKLGHGDPDDQDQDRGFDIRSPRDRETFVGFGQEEVEPHGRRYRGEDAGETVARSGNADDRGHEQQSRVGISGPAASHARRT
jgi:hypothetical protein